MPKIAFETPAAMLQLDVSSLFAPAAPLEIIVVKQEELDEAIAFYSSFFALKERTAHSADFLLPNAERILRVETSLDESMPTSLSVTVKDLPALWAAFDKVFSLDEISLQLQDHVYYAEQSDPFDVTWQISWPLEHAPLEKVRAFAAAQKIFIERRLAKMPTRWGHVADCAALCSDFDVEHYVNRWGLPQFEEYDGAQTPAMPEYHWWHFLADGTLAFFKYDTHLKTCALFVDPGEPRHALTELGLKAEDWAFNQEPNLHFVRDDNGDTTGTWQMLRQDESGNAFAVKKGLTEYEARRWVQIYEARGHKQLYWCESQKL